MAIEWAEKAIGVLRKLLGVLELTIASWETFRSEDAHYFSNIPSPVGVGVQQGACRSLQMVHELFHRLKSLRERLSALKMSLDGYKSDVSGTHSVHNEKANE